MAKGKLTLFKGFIYDKKPKKIKELASFHL